MESKPEKKRQRSRKAAISVDDAAIQRMQKEDGQRFSHPKQDTKETRRPASQGFCQWGGRFIRVSGDPESRFSIRFEVPYGQRVCWPPYLGVRSEAQ
jgi:hypothetical protein